MMRRAIAYAQFQLVKLENAELQCFRHAGVCDIGSGGGRGKLRQGRSKLHHALHAGGAERHRDL